MHTVHCNIGAAGCARAAAAPSIGRNSGHTRTKVGVAKLPVYPLAPRRRGTTAGPPDGTCHAIGAWCPPRTASAAQVGDPAVRHVRRTGRRPAFVRGLRWVPVHLRHAAMPAHTLPVRAARPGRRMAGLSAQKAGASVPSRVCPNPAAYVTFGLDNASHSLAHPLRKKPAARRHEPLPEYRNTPVVIGGAARGKSGPRLLGAARRLKSAGRMSIAQRKSHPPPEVQRAHRGELRCCMA